MSSCRGVRREPVEPPSLELADLRSCMRGDEQPRSSAQLGVDVVRTVAGVDLSLRCNRAVVAFAANGRGTFARETTTWTT